MPLDDNAGKHHHEAEHPVVLKPMYVRNPAGKKGQYTGKHPQKTRDERPLDPFDMLCLSFALGFFLL